MYDEQETEINLKDLFIYILKKWRIFLIGMVICGVIGCGVSIYKMVTNTPDHIKARLDKIEAKDSDVIDKDSIKQYSDYIALYNAQLDKEDESVILTFDPNNMYSGYLSYSIQSTSTEIDRIVQYLSNLMDRDDNWQKLLDASGLDCTLDAFKELCGYSCSKISNSSILSEYDKVTNGTVSASFIFNKEDLTKTMMAEFKKLIEKDFATLQTQSQDFNYFEISNRITFGTSSNVTNAINNAVTYRQSLLSSITTLEKGLSDDELLYYSYNYDYAKLLEGIEKGGFAKKPPVFGALIGCVLIGIYVVCEYLLSNRVKSEEDAEKFHLPILCSLKLGYSNKNKIDEWINNMYTVEFNDFAYLKSAIKALKKKQILLCSDNDMINKELRKMTNIKIVKTLDIDNKAVDAINKCDGVILVCKVDETKDSTIKRSMEVAKNYKKEVLGIITVR